MSKPQLSAVEIARRNGCNDPIILAQIERAEYLSKLIHGAAHWIASKVRNACHLVVVRCLHHAH